MSPWLFRAIGVLILTLIWGYFNFAHLGITLVAGAISPSPDTGATVPSPPNKEFQLDDVLFDQNKAEIRADAEGLLQKNAQKVKPFKNINILIEGYADIRGEEQYNIELAEARATSVRDYLVALGISAERIKVVARGATRKFSSGNTEEDFQLNRRAHFVVGSAGITGEVPSRLVTQSSEQKNITDESTIYQVLERKLKKMASTKILFGPPREMKLGKPEKISAQISMTLIPELQSAVEEAGRIDGGEIVIGQAVSLRLSGNNFDIYPDKHSKNRVVSEGVEEWNWNAIPLKRGLNSLLLTAVFQVNIEGRVEEKKEYPLYLKAIDVSFDPIYSASRLIGGHWYWFAGTLIILSLILWTAKRHL